MQHARRILADKQAAWDSTMARIDKEKADKAKAVRKVHYLIDGDFSACGALWAGAEEITTFVSSATCKKCVAVYNNEAMKEEKRMAKRIHFITDDDECPCGFEYEDDEQVSDDIDEVTCKKCIKAAEELEALEEEEELEEETEEEVSAPAPVHLKAIFTLAPRTLDKGDTKEVGCHWLYQGTTKQGLNQPIRKVLVPEIQAQNQINAYLHPTPYLTFQEQSLEKYITQGKVTEAPVSEEVLEEQTAMILNTIAPNKEDAMPKKPIVKVQTSIKPVATITEVVHANMPAPSALDAILAQPIAHIMQQAPVGVPEEFLTRLAAPKRPLALPEERSEDALVQGMNPPSLQTLTQLVQEMSMLLHKVAAESKANNELLSAYCCMVDVLINKTPGCGEESAPAPEPEPEIWGSILDVATMPAPIAPPVWGNELDMLVEPVASKVKSTLTVFTGGQKAPNAAPKAARKGGSKTDPAIIKAIQKAWNTGKVTQAALAEKYGIDDKKVWYFCSSRCKQLV